MSQNIMRAPCAVIRPDHFKFASYGPEYTTQQVVCTQLLVHIIMLPRIRYRGISVHGLSNQGVLILRASWTVA